MISSRKLSGSGRRLGVGPRKPKIIVVAEAFGAEEAKKGQPLVGQSGKFFNQILSQAGVAREEVYLTNLVNERPNGPAGPNDFSEFFDPDAKLLTPLGLEARAGLIEELSAVECDTILALGRPSATALINPDPSAVGRLSPLPYSALEVRGSPYASAALPGRVVIRALHPAYVMRSGQYMWRYHMKRDVEKALFASGKGVSIIPQRDIRINQSLDQVVDFLRTHKDADLGFDIETSWQRMDAFALAPSDNLVMSVMLDARWSTKQYNIILDELKSVLEHGSGRIITQNGNFDSFYVDWWHDLHIPLDRLDDTMVGHHILFPDLPKSLGLLASYYTYEPFYKADGATAKQIKDMDLYQTYNAKDAAVTREIWPQVDAMLDQRQGAREYYDEWMSNHPALQQIQRNGFRQDIPARAKLAGELTEEADEVQEELDAMVRPKLLQFLAPLEKEMDELIQRRDELKAGSKELTQLKKVKDPDSDTQTRIQELLSQPEAKTITPRITEIRTRLRQWSVDRKDHTTPFTLPVNSDTKVKEYFYEFLGEKPIYKPGKERKVTVDDMAMEILAKRGLGEAKLIQQIRGLRKMVGTYLTVPLIEDRWHSNFNLRGTKFGRFSSDKLFFYYGNNLQNVPPRARVIFLPDGGRKDRIYFLAEYDLAQAEWVVVAVVSGDERMMEVVSSGKDPHIATAVLTMHVPEHIVLADDKIVGKVTDPIIVTQRRAQHTAEVKKALASIHGLPRTGSLRQSGKRRNHSLNYGEGPTMYASQWEIPLADAKAERQSYLDAYPGVPEWWASVQFQLANGRTLYDPFGHPIYFMGSVKGKQVNVWPTVKEGLAAVPQKTICTIVNRGMRWAKANMHPSMLRSQNHDSITVQHYIDPTDSAESNADRLSQEFIAIREAMTVPIEYQGRRAVIGVDVKAGLNWADASDTNPRGLRGAGFDPDQTIKLVRDLQEVA